MDVEACKSSPVDINLNAQKMLQFTIMSYNILADSNLKPDIFKYVEPKFLMFEYRSKLIKEEIAQLLPDVIALQELDHYSDFYEQQLKDLGYETYYEMKVPDFEGIMIGWKKSKFIEKSRRVLKLRGELDNEYAKKQIAIYVDLEPVGGGPSLKVINLHLFWDYRKENIKYFQALKLLNWVEDEYPKQETIVICGDFNSAPKSNVMNLILGKDKEIKQAHSEESLKELKKLYEEGGSRDFQKRWLSAYENPKFTCFTERFHETIDYILFNQNSPIKLLETAPLMTEAEASKEKGLPNSVKGSDHLPLLATFGLTLPLQENKTQL